MEAEGRLSGKRIRGALAEAALLLAAIILPAMALAAEATGKFSARLFFNPIPTIVHAVLVGLAPAANLAVWLGLRRGWTPIRTFLSFLNGAALAISLLYILPFLPALPFASAAVVMLGWYRGVGLIGLLPLGPFLALFGGLVLRRRLMRQFYTPPLAGRPAFGLGFIASLLILLLTCAGDLFALAGLKMACDASPARRNQGVWLLRRTRPHDLLLRVAHGVGTVYDEGVSRLVTGGKGLDAAQARRLYYQATGRDALTLPPPGAGSRAGQTAEGPRVGPRQEALEAASTRLEGLLEAEAGVGLFSWVLGVRNTGKEAHALQAVVALPPGAVVTRVSLDAPDGGRDAAFAPLAPGTNTGLAVEGKGNPSLAVTTCGPDRIHVVGSPIAADGLMSIRLGLTVPLEADPEAAGRWTLRLPLLMERNFESNEGGQEVRIVSRAPVEIAEGLSGLACRGEGEKGWLVEGRVPVSDAWVAPILVVKADGDGTAWCEDGIGEKAGRVRQVMALSTGRRPQSVMLVVDGSASMAQAAPRILHAVTNHFPEGIWLGVMQADDGTPRPPLLKITKADRMGEFAQDMARFTYDGGRCGVRFLEAAWDALSREAGPAALVWVHGPQPLMLDAVSGFRHRMEREPGMARLYTLQVGPGMDALGEACERLDNVAALPPCMDPGPSLSALFASWKQGNSVPRRLWARDETDQADGARVSDALARLWARQQAALILASGTEADSRAAASLGVRYGMVTPVTGAFLQPAFTGEVPAEAGEPSVDPIRFPALPPPWIWMLTAVAMVAGLMQCPKRESV